MDTFKYLGLCIAVLNFSFVFAQATNPYPPTNMQYQYTEAQPNSENQNSDSFNTPARTYQDWLNNPKNEPDVTSPSITQPQGGETKKEVNTNPASAPDYMINNPP